MLVGAAAADGEPPPNIVLIVVDDLGYNDIGPYGESFADTPALDRMAAEGLRFTDAYAAAPVCSPTRAAILSGRYGPRNGVTDVIVPGYETPDEDNTETKLIPPASAMNLPSGPPTLPEILRRAGYRTAHVGKWHLGEFGAGGTEPEDVGFDEAYDWDALAYGRWYATSFVGGVMDLLPEGVQSAFGWSEYTVPDLTDVAIEFIEENADRPFFVHLAHYTVHDPIQAQPETIEKYEDRLAELGAEPSPAQNPPFAAMLDELDASVGTLLDALERTDVDDRTVVIFTSDNGGLVTAPTTRMIALLWETPWPHTPSTDLSPLRHGKGTLYEGGLRVPYIVRWPGVTPAGAVSSTVVHSIDILPTLTALAGVPEAELPDDIDGISLAGELRGEPASTSRDEVYWHFPYYPSDAPDFTPAAAIRSGDYKGIHFYEDDRFELYDLAADIGETRDLAATQPDVARRLQESLRRWQDEVGASLPRPNPRF